MDATFLAKLKSDYPDYRFVAGAKFSYRPPRTIIYKKDSEEVSDCLLMLHELGHALSHHRTFKTEVGRLKMEVQAWEKARELCTVYGVEIDKDLIQEELDTYRDWLHQKSRCPECGLTRFQTPDGIWHCPIS
ncbi:hypothetical protein IJ076_01805 [Candidatus Saccharibacteria bacterium]|nr:hypothetical protein [Candidatus Saccharibacteria bacterium]